MPSAWGAGQLGQSRQAGPGRIHPQCDPERVRLGELGQKMGKCWGSAVGPGRKDEKRSGRGLVFWPYKLGLRNEKRGYLHILCDPWMTPTESGVLVPPDSFGHRHHRQRGPLYNVIDIDRFAGFDRPQNTLAAPRNAGILAHVPVYGIPGSIYLPYFILTGLGGRPTVSAPRVERLEDRYKV
jgi:hypothetical protein